MTIPANASPAAAPAANPAPAQTGAAPKEAPAPKQKPSFQDRARQYLERKAASAPADPAAPAPGAPAPATDPAKPAPAVDVPKTPAERAADADKASRALRAAQEAERARRAAETEVKTLRAQLEAASARADIPAAKFDEWKKDLGKFAADNGLDVRQFLKDIAERKINPPTPEQIAAEQTKTEAQLLKERLDARDEQDRQAREQNEFQQTVAVITKELEGVEGEKYPVTAALPGAAERILAKAKRDGTTPLVAAVALESAALDEVQRVLQSDRAIGALLKNPELKARLAKLLGGQVTPEQQPSQQVTSGQSPTTLTNAVTTSGAPVPPVDKRKLSDAERRKNAEAVAARLLKKP